MLESIAIAKAFGKWIMQSRATCFCWHFTKKHIFVYRTSPSFIWQWLVFLTLSSPQWIQDRPITGTYCYRTRERRQFFLLLIPSHWQLLQVRLELSSLSSNDLNPPSMWESAICVHLSLTRWIQLNFTLQNCHQLSVRREDSSWWYLDRRSRHRCHLFIDPVLLLHPRGGTSGGHHLRRAADGRLRNHSHPVESEE